MTITPVLWRGGVQANINDANFFQHNASISALTDGGYVVYWDDSAANDVKGRRYDILGNAVGGELNSGFTINSGGRTVAVAGTPDGGYTTVALEYGQQEPPSYILLNLNHFNQSGVYSLELNLYSAPSLFVTTVDVGALNNGSYAVTYTTAAGASTDVYATIVAPNGASIGPIAIDNSADGQYLPRVAVLNSGNFVVVWQDQYNGSDADHDIRYTIKSPAGANVLSPNAVPAAFSMALESEPDVAALAGGGFVIVWTDAAGDASGAGINAQIFNGDGATVSGSILVNLNYESGDQGQPAVCGLSDGGFIVAWYKPSSPGFPPLVPATPSGILGQRFDAAGGRVGDTFLIAENAYDPELTLLEDGRFAVSYSISNGFFDAEVVTSIWDPRTGTINGENGVNDAITATPAGSTINGLSGNDVLYGQGAIDFLYGGIGNDTIRGGASNDQLYGDTENDYLYGGLGGDRLDGGGGYDYVRYDEANYGHLRISLLASATNTGTAAAGDTYFGIEGVIAGAGNDIVYGNSSANIIDGRGGNDTLFGGLGADSLRGGDGIDYARYDDANYGNLVLSLANSAQNTGSAAAGDLYNGIEGIIAGAGNDRVGGNGFINYLFGGGGNDLIAGNFGNDTLSGGAGLDTFIFNTTLEPSSNRDTITDFVSIDDTIQIDRSVFSSSLPIGVLSADRFKVGPVATDATDRIIYNQSTGALYFDADGNAGAFAQIQFATLSSKPVISNTDFVIVA